jgi:alpha-N-arabinofuranosidase
MINGILGTTVKGTISRHIYGHFAEHLGRCIYEGIWVGEGSPIPNTEGYRNDVLEALRCIRVPVLRWPGGCFADTYHWMDGIGPREVRPSMLNIHWGGVTESNHFGTHEFFRLCELLGAEPYVCGNVGSGTVREMAEWVEYMTFSGKSPMADLRRKNGREEPFRLKYFGVGNENWGCGGRMRPEYYADEFRRYNLYCRDYGSEPLYRIACGPNSDDYDWTQVLIQEGRNTKNPNAKQWMQGLALHYYSIFFKVPGQNGSATDFDEKEYYGILCETLKMETLIQRHGATMDRYDPEKRVGLVIDEWGTWYRAEPGTNPAFLYQQNTMRDAVVAAINLNLFNRHCDRVHMANIAQMVNVLQAVILTEGDRILKTPTFHVFEMFSGHQDAELLDLALETQELVVEGKRLPKISGSASRAKDGSILITLVNLAHDSGTTLRILVPGGGKLLEARELKASDMKVCNTFDEPNTIVPKAMAGAALELDWLNVPMSAMSIVAVRLALP